MKKEKVKDEVSKEQAKKMVLENDGMVHTFYNMPFGILGGDHDLESVNADIDKSYACAKTGPDAARMGHGLAIIPFKDCNQIDILFVETKKLKGRK